MRVVITAAVGTLLALSVVVGGQPASIVIRAARLLDGKGGTVTNAAVVVQGTKIVRIDQNTRNATYDLGTATLMPGWIDTHAHIASHFDRGTGRAHSPQARDETPQQAMLYAVENAYNILMSGFTTVQSPGAELDKDLRDWIAEGRIPGPPLLTPRASLHRTT